MRSYALEVKDPMSIDLLSDVKPIEIDRKELERELEQLTRPYIRWEKGTTVSKGDVAVCRLVSDCPRFNREKVKFAAGSGLFSKELETLAIGMSVGETRETVLTEGPVALTLLEATNKIVPAPSDDMVEGLGLDGVCTLTDFKEYLFRQQWEKALGKRVDEAARDAIDEVVNRSAFVLYQEDWQYVVNLKLEQTRRLCRWEGLTLEEMTPEQFNGRIPVKSYQEFVALEQRQAWQSLCLHLLGRWFSQRDGFSVNEEAYAQHIRRSMEDLKAGEDEAKNIETAEAFAFNAYVFHAIDRIVEAVRQRLTAAK